MRNEVKLAANKFLLATYGFSEEIRMRLIEKASREIVQNCLQLLAAVTTKGTTTPKSHAHRLKSNLNSLGLHALAEEAQTIELHEYGRDTETLLRMTRELCHKITDKCCDLP